MASAGNTWWKYSFSWIFLFFFHAMDSVCYYPWVSVSEGEGTRVPPWIWDSCCIITAFLSVITYCVLSCFVFSLISFLLLFSKFYILMSQMPASTLGGWGGRGATPPPVFPWVFLPCCSTPRLPQKDTHKWEFVSIWPNMAHIPNEHYFFSTWHKWFNFVLIIHECFPLWSCLEILKWW